MADELVLQAQRFLNRTYSNGTKLGISKVPEDGQTGWTTMYALTRALQYEMGLTTLSDTFGPTTLSTLQAKYPVLNASTSPSWAFTCIIQSALYCKGYDGGGIDGIYSSRVQASVQQMKQDMGVSGALPGGSLEPKVFKALLTMDAYVTVNNGSSAIRSIQQWLNGRYLNRRDYYIIPCDGHHSRDVARSMLFAVQYELGMADGTANGVFGPGTQAGLKANTVSVGNTTTWARLFTAAMILNKRDGVPFGNFTSEVSGQVQHFQLFAKLPVTGVGDFQTWASLLVSYGDQTRRGEACDGVTKITPARAQALKSAGYKYIGRYLFNPSSTDLPEKQIQPGELDTIAEYGLRCFPIFQTWSRSTDYFHYAQGCADAFAAIRWAQFHGFKAGSIIYFAVDYDALDHEVTSHVIPHFRGVWETVAAHSRYDVGIYGPRNVCQRVSDKGYAVTSFVSDMSSGFSGNLGYSLPTNWAFDQIVTKSIGSGSGFIEIDNNIASGLDIGQNSFSPQPAITGLDDLFNKDYQAAALSAVQTYLESIGVPESGGEGWTRDKDWVTWGVNTTTECFNVVMKYDIIFTELARALKIRKALIQSVVLWEWRKLWSQDALTDEAVKAGLLDDCSTGLGQIYGNVARKARNFCIEQGIINGTVLNEGFTRAIWDRLHTEPGYNLASVAYLTMQNGYEVNGHVPTLSDSMAKNERTLARYNGTLLVDGKVDEDVAKYGRELVGLYAVLENYNALSRAI